MIKYIMVNLTIVLPVSVKGLPVSNFFLPPYLLTADFIILSSSLSTQKSLSKLPGISLTPAPNQ